MLSDILRKIAAKKRRGLGLLETIAALTVMTTGLVTLMTLVVAASVSRSASEYETVASNLAREAVEVAVSVRNGNWMNNVSPFYSGLVGTGDDHTFAAVFDPGTIVWTLEPDPNAINDPATAVYKFTDTGLMVQAVAGQPPGTTVIPYRRLLTIDHICTDGYIAVSGSNCSAHGDAIGLKLTGAVQWSERNKTHSLAVEERIYDWR